MKVGDWCILAAVLITAAGLWLAFSLFAESGGAVEIVTPTETRTVSLSEDAVYTLTGRENITVTVEVKGGTVCFRESGCPDKLCVNTGKLQKQGATAACLPAGITLRVVGEGEVDAVVG